MKFRYIGKNETMVAFGHDFSGGKTPNVTDESAIKRLSTNTHFERVEEVNSGKTFGSKAPAVKSGAEDNDKDFPALPGEHK